MMSPEAVAVKVVWKETVELDQSMECAQWAPPESEWGLVRQLHLRKERTENQKQHAERYKQYLMRAAITLFFEAIPPMQIVRVDCEELQECEDSNPNTFRKS